MDYEMQVKRNTATAANVTNKRQKQWQYEQMHGKYSARNKQDDVDKKNPYTSVAT